jgi:GR25 family glycosyltransferase involved in LPS biosynthesis
MELLRNTLVINLESRPDRLQNVLCELQKLGVDAQRYNANKTANGAIGCTISHIKCLEIAKQNDWKHVFICEDDITFLDPALFVKNLTKFYESDYDWDVVIAGGNNALPYRKASDFCIQVHNCQTTTGYIVQNHYYDVLIQNFKDGLKNLLKNPESKSENAIDMYWKRLQNRDRWYMIIPPTVIQCAGYSDIEGRVVNYQHLMTDLDKEWLYQYNRQQMLLQQQQQQQSMQKQKPKRKPDLKVPMSPMVFSLTKKMDT